jgi:hypothetical protein
MINGAKGIIGKGALTFVSRARSTIDFHGSRVPPSGKIGFIFMTLFKLLFYFSLYITHEQYTARLRIISERW